MAPILREAIDINAVNVPQNFTAYGGVQPNVRNTYVFLSDQSSGIRQTVQDNEDLISGEGIRVFYTDAEVLV